MIFTGARLHQNCSFDNYRVENDGQMIALSRARQYVEEFDGNSSSLVSRLPKVSFIADIISATVMINTDLPRSSSSLPLRESDYQPDCRSSLLLETPNRHAD
jgi:hypothetical protein